MRTALYKEDVGVTHHDWWQRECVIILSIHEEKN